MEPQKSHKTLHEQFSINPTPIAIFGPLSVASVPLSSGRDQIKLSDLSSDMSTTRPGGINGSQKTAGYVQDQQNQSPKVHDIEKPREPKSAQQKAEEKERKKRKKEIGRARKHEFQCEQLKQSQRYLGLRQTLQQKGTDHIKEEPSAWSSVEPALFNPDKLPIIIAFDVECYERNQNAVTEIGIAKLDSSSLINLAPGEKSEAWFAQVRHRHFRIWENKHLRNGTFVADNAERFGFGKSEWTYMKDIAALLRTCFSADELDENGNAVGQRNLIVIGHNVNQDFGYLRRWFDIKAAATDVIDTNDLYACLTGNLQGAGLSTVMYNLGLDGWSLHNAGNDAAYTMQAFLRLAIRGTTMKPFAEEEMNHVNLSTWKSDWDNYSE
jgi:hypothetical protein